MAFVAIDIGGTRIKLAAFHNTERVCEKIIDAQAQAPMADKLENLAQIIRLWQSEYGEIQGIAIAIPGIVDTKNQKVISINGKHEDAPQTDFVAWALKEFNCPLVLNNDAKAALYGEWQFGAGRGSNNLIMITLGTGIGTAAIVDGQPLQGAQFFAGNLGGHTLLERHHPNQCNCLAYGCAESLASTWALEQDLQSIFTAAQQGDKTALTTHETIIHTWALLIHNLIMSFSPDTVVIGGGIAAQGENLLAELKAHLPENIWYQKDTINFAIAEQPDYAALLGGCWCLMNANIK